MGAEEATAILELGRELGIDTLDTAIAYGDSERLLGQIGVRDWKVISKLPPVPVSCTDIRGWVRTSVLGSARRVGVPRLHGILLHRSQELLAPHGDALGREMLALRNEGEIEKIGVSIYDPEELDAIRSRLPLDIVQAPLNVLDRRIVNSGWLARLRDSGTEVHARSVFLQGLLLMNSGERPAAFDRWQALWECWEQWLRDFSLNPLNACLGFALSQAGVNRVVVGVASETQLREIAACLDAPSTVPPAGLSCGDPNLINPSRWGTA